MTCNNAFSETIDSLRLERKADGVYVIHRVDAGETLFSISKRYQSDLVKIAEVNKLEGYAIDLGQILEIPLNTQPKEDPDSIDKRTVHLSLIHI